MRGVINHVYVIFIPHHDSLHNNSSDTPSPEGRISCYLSYWLTNTTCLINALYIYIYMSRAPVTVHMRMRRIYLSKFEALNVLSDSCLAVETDEEWKTRLSKCQAREFEGGRSAYRNCQTVLESHIRVS